MKKIYLGAIFILIAGVLVVFIKYPEREAAFGKISDFYGEWGVVETQKSGGTLISNEKFRQLMTNPLVIEKDRMNFFGVEITSPTYKYYRIDNKPGKGVVQDRTTSSFYGFYTDREFIHQFRIIKNNGIEGVFEALSKEELLFMVAGRIVIVKRKK